MVLFMYVPRSCHWTIDKNKITIINIRKYFFTQDILYDFLMFRSRCLGSVSLPFGGTSTPVKAFAGTRVVASVGFSIGATCKSVTEITATHPVY